MRQDFTIFLHKFSLLVAYDRFQEPFSRLSLDSVLVGAIDSKTSLFFAGHIIILDDARLVLNRVSIQILTVGGVDKC